MMVPPFSCWNRRIPVVGELIHRQLPGEVCRLNLIIALKYVTTHWPAAGGAAQYPLSGFLPCSISTLSPSANSAFLAPYASSATGLNHDLLHDRFIKRRIISAGVIPQRTNPVHIHPSEVTSGQNNGYRGLLLCR